MKQKSDKKKNIKKTTAALAGVLLTVLLCLLLAGLGHTDPENPMEDKKADASRMYLTSSTLAMDQQKLADVENANINSGGTEAGAQQDEEQEPETEEQTKEQNAQDDPEQETAEDQEQKDPENSQTAAQQPLDGQQTGSWSQAQNDSASSANDSLLSLIQKNEKGNGGNSGGNEPGQGTTPGGTGGDRPGTIPDGGGQQATLGPEASAELFTTSIVDGDQVTEQEYPFTITLTEKGKQLQLVSMNVELNGSLRSCKESDSLKLKEGANTVIVRLRFRDEKSNQIDARSRAYTLYYMPVNGIVLVVQNAKTGEYLTNGQNLTVYSDNFRIKVTAYKAVSANRFESVSYRVRLRGVAQKGSSDGIFNMKLSVGNQNVLSVTAGEDGANQEHLECTINYVQDDFTLSFESDAVTETISGWKFGGYTEAKYKSKSEKFQFRLSCSSITGAEKITSVLVTTRYGTTDMIYNMGANGYISCNLDSADTGTTIQVKCLDSEGKERQYRWIIYFTRIFDQEENQRNAPDIRVNVENNQTVDGLPFVMTVNVVDHNGGWLYPEKDFQVYVNGERKEYDSAQPGDRTYEYRLYLSEGANTITINATDNEQYPATRTLTVYYTPEKEKELTVHFVFSAEMVGLGTLIDEEVKVPAGYTIAQVVEERLQAYGYITSGYGESTNSSYWLTRIAKGGLTSGWSISEEQRARLELEGLTVDDSQFSADSLGEKDFTSGSGWMLAKNHYFVAQSLGTWPVQDRDLVHLVYTLDLGKDVADDNIAN